MKFYSAMKQGHPFSFLFFFTVMLLISSSAHSATFVSNLPKPSGMAIHPTERYLYVKSGVSGTLWKIPILKNGNAGPIEVVTDQFAPPMDIDFDSAGNLYGVANVEGVPYLYIVSSTGSVCSSSLNYSGNAFSGIAIEAPGLGNNRIFFDSPSWNSHYFSQLTLDSVTCDDRLDSEKIAYTNFVFRFLLHRSGRADVVGSSDDKVLTVNIDNGSTTTLVSNMVQPNGLAEDSKGNLFIADTGAGKIIKRDALGKITEVARNLSGPTGLVFDPETGLLFISEMNGNRITTLPVGIASSGKVTLKIKNRSGKWGATVTAPKGTSPNTPAACQDGKGNLYVFINKIDNTIAMNKRTPAGKWGSWQNVSNTMRTSSAPSASYRNGRIMLYVRGMDDKVWEGVYNLSTNKWSAWTEIKGMTTPDSPESVIDNAGNTFLIIRGMR